MEKTASYYIGCLRLDLIPDAYVVEVSFVDTPPRQDSLTDLPYWALSSKNAIWFVEEKQSLMNRALSGERIKKDLIKNLVH